jgi:hypothetical protein
MGTAAFVLGVHLHRNRNARHLSRLFLRRIANWILLFMGSWCDKASTSARMILTCMAASMTGTRVDFDNPVWPTLE